MPDCQPAMAFLGQQEVDVNVLYTRCRCYAKKKLKGNLSEKERRFWADTFKYFGGNTKELEGQS